MKKKITKLINPITGKKFTVYETLVLALILKNAPRLIEMWHISGTEKPLDEWLAEYDSTVKIKGAIKKVIACNYPMCIKALVEIWHCGEFERFDDFLMYHHSANDAQSVK